MTAEDDPCAVLDQVLDRGDGGADAGVVGDFLVIIKRHVEIDSHEYLLPHKIVSLEISHALLRHFKVRILDQNDHRRGKRGRELELGEPIDRWKL